MVTPVASTSRLPAYVLDPQNVVSRVRSLSALHPDPTHPAHKSLLADLDLSRDSARIWANSQSGIILCPQAETLGQADLEGWAREAGYFVVVSTSRRRIDRISVKVVSRQSVSFPQDKGRREEDEVFSREATLADEDGGGIWLEKGINTFEFAINLPPSMCITVDELHARIYQFVVATAIGSAKGLFGKDLSAEERVFSMSVPADHSDLVFHHSSADFHDQLGLCQITASSSLFTVAGALLFTLNLASPPPSLRIFAFKAYFNLSHDVTSFRDPTKKATLSKKVMLVEKGFQGPYTNKAIDQLRSSGKEAQALLFDASRAGHDGFGLEEMARLPPDFSDPPDSRSVRASTYPTTKTCIRTTCELVVELYFTTSATADSTSRSNLRIAQILKKPVFLNSCGCMPGRLSLPDYAPNPETWKAITVRVPCRCDESDETILAAEWKHVRASRAAAAARGSGEEVEQPVAPGRKVGESYDPSTAV